ncbi:hypothetical protein [Microbacterium sp. 179-I 3D4 NHS]|uniref:hypothetical protein n=1 Tax=Microbacterium sp. 179-I 3D4 NHS TaxID=3142381 RepID=UPI0039A31293
MDTSDNTTSRPFGYWLKAVDRLMAAEFASAFDGDVSRRDWRLLNVVDGTAPARRPLSPHKLHRLVERGWVAPEGGGWTLTDEGRAAKERLGGIADGIRTRIADAVSDDDMATTLASLEKIARTLGWDEETPLPRGRRGFGRHGHGFARHGHGFAPHHDHDRHGFGPRFPGRPGFGPHAECHHHGHGVDGHEEHGHGRHHGGGHGPHRVARMAQHAYERGFDAGFTRGRDA